MSSDAELRAQAVAALKKTTTSYPAWVKAVAAGHYHPPDGSATQWGIALNTLAQIGAVAPQPPGLVVALPVGPFTDLTSEQFYPQANPPQTVAKIHVHDVKSSASRINGVTLIEYPALTESSGPWTLSDIIAQNIGNLPYDPPPGTQDAGLAIGYQCNATRIVASGTWMGIELWCQCKDSVLTDVTIGQDDGKGGYTLPVPKTGVYFEHYARRTTLRRFDIYSLGSGIPMEWWYADAGYAAYVAKEYPAAMPGKAGPCCNVIEEGRIYCPPQDADGTTAGIFMDAGVWGNQIAQTGEALTFWGPGDAIGAPLNLAGPDDNQINLANCVFLNAGRQVYKHDRAIG